MPYYLHIDPQDGDRSYIGGSATVTDPLPAAPQKSSRNNAPNNNYYHNPPQNNNNHANPNNYNNNYYNDAATPTPFPTRLQRTISILLPIIPLHADNKAATDKIWVKAHWKNTNDGWV